MDKIEQAYNAEIKLAHTAKVSGDLVTSFHHLERAHILGQRHFTRHFQTHWEMLKIGVKRADAREITGQCVRIIAVFPASIFGWVPDGNTGGANVSALKPMPIPPDLEAILGATKKNKRVK